MVKTVHTEHLRTERDKNTETRVALEECVERVRGAEGDIAGVMLAVPPYAKAGKTHLTDATPAVAMIEALEAAIQASYEYGLHLKDLEERLQKELIGPMEGVEVTDLKIINLTEDDVYLLDEEEHTLVSFLRQPIPAQADRLLSFLNWAAVPGPHDFGNRSHFESGDHSAFLLVPVGRKHYGPILGLPDHVDGTHFIVSPAVAEAATETFPMRQDLLMMDGPVYDGVGALVGYRGFAVT